MKRHYRIDQYSHAPMVLGLDVAREGDDRSVLFPRQGLVAYKPLIYRNAKSPFLAGAVAQHEDRVEADGTIIDGTGGWGTGVFDALVQMGRSPFDCQFAGKPFDEQYANKRAEIWFEMAKWVKGGGALPDIPELVAELTVPTYSFKGDKLLMEPKEQIKKRLGRSPDLADALALTFAFPVAKRRVGIVNKPNPEYNPLRALDAPSDAVVSEYEPLK